jgi:ribosomal protein S12 methylthiotransferase
MASSLITPSRAKRDKPTIGFVNLGCSKNQVDSEVMLGTLVAGGFQLTGDARAAEVVIINTCGFIEEAKQESINSIIEHGRLKKSGSCRVLIAAGMPGAAVPGRTVERIA